MQTHEFSSVSRVTSSSGASDYRDLAARLELVSLLLSELAAECRSGSFLMVRDAEGLARVAPLVRSEVIWGRSGDPGFRAGDDPRASRHHFGLSCNRGQWSIVDLGSRNGTWVNGRRLSQSRLLCSGDVVQAGRSVMIFVFGA